MRARTLKGKKKERVSPLSPLTNDLPLQEYRWRRNIAVLKEGA